MYSCRCRSTSYYSPATASSRVYLFRRLFDGGGFDTIVGGRQTILLILRLGEGMIFGFLCFASGSDGWFFPKLGGVRCSLHGDSRYGAGFVVCADCYVRLGFLPLLVFEVEMFLFPFGGMRFQVGGVAGNVGDCFWAAIFGGAEDVRSRFLLLLHALTMTLPMFFQSSRCVLVVVLMRWLLRLNKVWASSF
jgi:hypothetical protein